MNVTQMLMVLRAKCPPADYEFVRDVIAAVKWRPRVVGLTDRQQRCLDLADDNGGVVSLNEALAAGCGPANCGILVARGLMADAGSDVRRGRLYRLVR